MGSISFVANTRSLISMAWLWCGVIIEANITSASLCGPDAGVAAAGLDGVLDVAGEVTELVVVVHRRTATSKDQQNPSAVVGAMSRSFERGTRIVLLMVSGGIDARQRGPCLGR